MKQWSKLSMTAGDVRLWDDAAHVDEGIVEDMEGDGMRMPARGGSRH